MGWVSVSLVWCCTTWYVCFSPLTYCYLNPQRTCFLSPCENFYSKNYLFVLIFGLGLCGILVFFFFFFFFFISMCCSLDVWLNAWETYSYCLNGLNNESWNWLHASMKIQIADIFFMFSKKDIRGFPRSPMHTNFVLHIIQVETLKKKKSLLKSWNSRQPLYATIH